MEETNNKQQGKRLKRTNTNNVKRQVPSSKVVSDPLESEEAVAEGEDLAATFAAELLIEEQRLSKRIDP